jgi:hypothetical protein
LLRRCGTFAVLRGDGILRSLNLPTVRNFPETYRATPAKMPFIFGQQFTIPYTAAIDQGVIASVFACK